MTARKRSAVVKVYWLSGILRAVFLCLFITGSPLRATAADMLWQYELTRVQEAITDGEYRKALDIAETFDKEFGKAKRSYKAKENWQELESATILSHLCIGSAERMCGNYGAAGNHFDYALKDLKQIKVRNIALNQNLQSRASVLLTESLFDRAAALDAGSHTLWLMAVIKWLQGDQAAAGAESAADIVQTTNSLLMLTYDILGTLAIDKALPLTKDSLKQLREAKKFLALAQQVREDRRFGSYKSYSVHGDEKITFLMNYGTMFLRRAELKLKFPDVPPADEDVGTLLDRASDYFEEAEERFSSSREITNHYAKLIHEGPLQKTKDDVVKELQREDSSRTVNDHRSRVDQGCLTLQKMLLAQAELDFKQSELAILKMRVAFDANRLETKDLIEGFDDAEQRLLDAADKLKLITDNEDHPFLVICYSELVALEAIRATMQERKPEEDYLKYLALAEDILAKKKLSQSTVQGHYLTAARDLWAKASGDEE